jgi:ABC-type Fe3+/spermidine/putrescine transport system ATPase subunit
VLNVERLAVQLGGFALEDVTFSVPEGAYCVLLGASGVGKTVILELLAGLLSPAHGTIAHRGRDLGGVPIQQRRFGLVYQDHALFPHLSVEANIGYSLSALPGSERRERVRALAEEVGAAHLLERRPGTLSLGEAQRVALARALATDPALLLLDEPLASLDAHSRTAIRALLRRLHRGGRTIIHVTHDYEEAVALATHVVVLEDGRIAQEGTPEELFHHPRSAFVAHFAGVRNFLPGRIEETGEECLFRSGAMRIHVATDAEAGPGYLLLRAEDITLSLERPAGSARNCFPGKIVDLEPVPHGMDVEVAAAPPPTPSREGRGEQQRLVARITRSSVSTLGLEPGKQVWVSWKSTAGRFVAEADGEQP